MPAFHPSHIKNMIDIASSLAYDDEYNVTMIMLGNSVFIPKAIE